MRASRGPTGPSLLLLAVFAAVGCERAPAPSEAIEPEPAPAAPAEPAEPAEPAAPAEPEAGPSALGDGYEVQAVTAGPYTAGEAGTFAVALAARDEWHLNEEYPTRVEVTGPGAVAFPAASLARTDAAEFGETKARFDVPFRATEAGEHAVEAKVHFAICTAETCIPTERTLAFRLPVE